MKSAAVPLNDLSLFLGPEPPTSLAANNQAAISVDLTWVSPSGEFDELEVYYFPTDGARQVRFLVRKYPKPSVNSVEQLFNLFESYSSHKCLLLKMPIEAAIAIIIKIIALI